MEKIRTIIADDEKKSRDGLNQLSAEFEDLRVNAICKDGLEAIEDIETYKPDLLLLDIQMPGISGFDVLKSISYKPFTIFITAYDQYAVKAFEVHALDYLLKPFTDLRFKESITNAIQIIRSNQQHHTIEALERLIASTKLNNDPNEAIHTSDTTKKLIIRMDGRIHLVDFEKISWIEAYDYYVRIHADTSYLIKDSLKKLIQHLPQTFLRVHKSAIINTNLIHYLEPIGHSEMIATLKGDIKVKVSRKYKDVLMTRISQKL